MPIPTKSSISGFLRADPDLSFTKDGVARLFVPVGIKQSVQDAEGHWHDVEPYKTAMVMYGPSAERAHAQFKSGDNFIAEGFVRPYTNKDGQEREEFRASRLGHDNNLTTYTVERRSHDREAQDRPAPGHRVEQDAPAAEPDGPSPDPVADVLAQREQQIAPEPVAVGAAGPAVHEAVAR